jgi:hypothetical protein
MYILCYNPTLLPATSLHNGSKFRLTELAFHNIGSKLTNISTNCYYYCTFVLILHSIRDIESFALR